MRKVVKEMLLVIILIIAGLLGLFVFSLVMWVFTEMMRGDDAGLVWMAWGTGALVVFGYLLWPISEYCSRQLGHLTNISNNKKEKK